MASTWGRGAVNGATQPPLAEPEPRGLVATASGLQDAPVVSAQRSLLLVG